MDDIDAIDWDRRLREDRAIAMKLLSMSLETGKDGKVVGYEGAVEFDELLYVVAVKCADGRTRTLSLEAALRRGHRVVHEGQTIRGKQVGGVEDVKPLSGGPQEIASTVATIASLFGHPAAGAAISTLVASGGSVNEMVSRLKAVLHPPK